MSKATDQADALARLSQYRALKPGGKVYTTVLHVSRSGMSRTIRTHIVEGGELVDISRDVAYATGMSWDRDRWGIKVSGCGMDMAFHVVYSLSRSLYPNGHKCTGKQGGYDAKGKYVPRCPSNDHSNDWGMLSNQYRADHPADYETQDSTAYCAARSEWIAAQPLYSRTRKHSDGGYALTKENA